MRNALVLSTLVLIACPDPAKDAPKAKVGEATKPVVEAPAPKGEVEVVPFSAVDSKIEWVGSKVTGKHEGGFRAFTGEIRLNAGQLEASTVTVRIDVDSLHSDSEKLSSHLRGADFFDAANHPTATFVLTALKTVGEGHELTGTLTLRGQKKSISFPAKISVSDAEVTAQAEFSINRKEFGMAYPGKPDDLIRDQVLVRLDIHAKRK